MNIMIRMFIPNELLLNLPSTVELMYSSDLFGNRISLKYNNKIFITDRSFYPKFNILTKNIFFLQSYRLNNIDSRFMIPYNDIKLDRLGDIGSNKILVNYYLENLSSFINNKLEEYAPNSKKIDFWKLPTKLLLQNSSIVYSYNLDDSCLCSYEILLKFASAGSTKITFYDPCYSINHSLIDEIIDLCSYFEWDYEHNSEFITVSNIASVKFMAYMSWCTNNYLDYFMNLLSLDYIECPNYNSLSEAFSDIIKE